MRFSVKKFFNPDFYVCEWKSRDGSQSGDFAALGSNKMSALSDAIKYLEGLKGMPFESVAIRLKKPSIKERIYAAIDS